MTIEIVKAIKSRWDSKSLSSSVTGGLWNSRAPEQQSMPYCVLTQVSAVNAGETHCNRNGRSEIQFDIYDDSGDAETSADLAMTVRDTFVNSHNAATAYLNPTGLKLVESRLSRDIVTQGVGYEQTYRSTFSIVFRYDEDAARRPA